MSIQIVIEGVAETRAAIVQTADVTLAKVGEGLVGWGHLIEYAGKANLAPHHWHGTAEQSTVTVGPVIEGDQVVVSVGLHGGMAPEGRPLEYGWKSESGKQPPISAIAEWLTSKPGLIPSPNVTRNSSGFIRRRGTIAAISQEAAVRSLAFVIARNIGRRGYSFGALHWLRDAMVETREEGLALLRRVLST